MNRYCIVFEGSINEWYTYVSLKNINALARYLNDKVLRHRYYVISAYLADDLDDTNLKNRLFFQSEYDNQCFIETYEERLLEANKILERLAM